MKNWWKNEKQRERKHMMGEEKVDDPGKPKKRKKNILTRSETSKVDANEQSMSNCTSDSHEEMKSNNFTLINHSENESDAEKCDKKGCDDTSTLISHSSHSVVTSNSSGINKSVNLLNFSDTSGDGKFIHKDFLMHENNRMNSGMLLSSRPSMDSSMFHKIPVGVCIDHNHGLFPFSDPHLNMHNCTKIYCDNNPVQRTNARDGNNSHVSSEEDVDVGI